MNIIDTKKKFIIFALVAVFLFGVDISTAQETNLPSGDEIAKNVNARDEGEYVSRTLKMEMMDKRGKKRERVTKGFRKYYGEEKKTVIFYLSPKNVKDTGFLTYDYPEANRDDDQWLYLPALRKVRRISASDRGDYFLGTDFSYEDIKKESKIGIEDYNRRTLGKEEIDGYACYVVESIPIDEKTAKELGYGKIKSWIDKNIWITRKSEFLDVKGNFLKTTNISDIRKVDGIWTVHKMKVNNHKTGHSTVFTFSDVDYKTPVDDSMFTERVLRKGI